MNSRLNLNQALSLEFCSRVFHNANRLNIFVDIFGEKLDQRPKKYKLQSKLILFSTCTALSTNSKAFPDQVICFPSSADHVMNLMFLKSDGIGDLTLVIPSVQRFLSGIVVHHGVAAVLIGELYVGIPLPSSFGVVSKVDGSGPAAVTINSVDHSTGDKSISHAAHTFCELKQI